MESEQRSLFLIMATFIVSDLFIVVLFAIQIVHYHCGENHKHIGDCDSFSVAMLNLVVDTVTYMLPVIVLMIIHFLNTTVSEAEKLADSGEGGSDRKFDVLSGNDSERVMCILSHASGAGLSYNKKADSPRSLNSDSGSFEAHISGQTDD